MLKYTGTIERKFQIVEATLRAALEDLEIARKDVERSVDAGDILYGISTHISSADKLVRELRNLNR